MTAMAASSVTTQRRGNRTKAVLPVRLRGKDSSGKTFDELVHTLDVTATGVRLGSVRRELNVTDEITLFFRTHRLQYRVVWTKKMKGTSEFQVGLQALAQERDAWGITTSPDQPIAQPPLPQVSGAL